MKNDSTLEDGSSTLHSIKKANSAFFNAGDENLAYTRAAVEREFGAELLHVLDMTPGSNFTDPPPIVVRSLKEAESRGGFATLHITDGVQVNADTGVRIPFGEELLDYSGAVRGLEATYSMVISVNPVTKQITAKALSFSNNPNLAQFKAHLNLLASLGFHRSAQTLVYKQRFQLLPSGEPSDSGFATSREFAGASA